MTQGFQQQDTNLNGCFSKSVPPAQHGQKADRKTAQPQRPVRVVEPRPGH
jgi:hypothetical protein